MSDCCSSDNSSCNSGKDKKSFPRKFSCPINSKDYVAVPKKTMLHHLNVPWEKELSDEQYYFCSDSGCDVVYFGLSGAVIYKNELRTQIGVKEKDENVLICYCFGVSTAAAKKNPDIKNFVTQKTKENLCDCETRNPSGRCCLKDFPKQIKQ